MQDQPNDALTMSLSPIGVVRSPIKKPMLTAGESDLSLAERMDKIKAYHQRVNATECELVVAPKWEELLDGFEAVDGSPIIDI